MGQDGAYFTERVPMVKVSARQERINRNWLIAG
jgi:hypothetical protein